MTLVTAFYVLLTFLLRSFAFIHLFTNCVQNIRSNKNMTLTYLSGFNNTFESEALPGALPIGQNCPQKVNYGLYAEQLSGSAFTAPRADNKKTWLYRIRPSVSHKPFESIDSKQRILAHFAPSPWVQSTPNQLRWSPFSLPSEPTDFIQGLHTIAGSGDASTRNGLAIHIYSANKNMTQTALYNADGDFLIVPQLGRLNVQTEVGNLHVEPNEILVIPVFITFSIEFNLFTW